jgi:hypothetical protein
MLRCPATDIEGFRCLLSPTHEGEHKWGRCEGADAEGHRCSLPPRHAGSHYQLWYDRHATAGDTHTIRYGGTERATSALADRAAAIVANFGWIAGSRSFEAGWLWRWPLGARLLAGLAAPRGRLTIEFEYRGRDEQPPS